jgi:hypothetical protein
MTSSFTYPAFTFSDPTQTLPEEFDLEITESKLRLDTLTYPWGDVLVVDAVGMDCDQELMPNLDITVRGVGQFVIEVEDALDARNNWQWIVDKKKPKQDFDSRSTFEMAGTRGASIQCGVEMDGTCFLPSKVVIFTSTHGVLILPTDKMRWHTPLLRWDFSRIETVFDTDSKLSLVVPGIGTLLFSFQQDQEEAVDDFLTFLEEEGCNFGDSEEDFWEERASVDMVHVICNQVSFQEQAGNKLPEHVYLYCSPAGMGALDSEAWGEPLACWAWSTIESVLIEEGEGLAPSLALEVTGYGKLQATDLEGKVEGRDSRQC